jgi:cysteine desulfurase family protein
MVSPKMDFSPLSALCTKSVVETTKAIPMPRLYLDHAATSWPKDPKVLDAVGEYLREDGATAGRGAYASALKSMNWVDRARIAIAHLIGAPNSTDVALMSSGTHALNEAIYGSIRPGCHVIATAIEHNSVLRPLERLRQDHTIQFDIAPCNSVGWVDPHDIFQLHRTNTRLVAISHASNVTGALQEIETIGKWCHEHDVIFLVDAAQSLGYVPIDVVNSHIDYLAAPGHKGLGGILGTGFLYLAKNRQNAHRPLLCGGTGSQSESLVPELLWPTKVEPGNLNLPGIVSLAVAAEILLKHPIQTLAKTMQADWEKFRNILSQIPKLQLHAGSESQRQVSVLSCTHASLAPNDLAAILDAEFQIETRSGLHCAAKIHNYLGTADNGTLRFSFGHYLNPQVEIVFKNVMDALSQC